MAQELNVNIVPQSYLPEIRVSENDNTLRAIKVNIVNEDGSPYEIPAGTTATFAGTKPSGLGFTAACTIEESAVSFAVSDTMSNEVGRFPAEIRFMDGEDRIGTCNVLMRVEPNPHPDDTTDGDREPLVNEITALLQQITEQADRVEEYSGKVLNMTVTAHESDEATVTKTEGDVVNLDFGLPRGPQGPQGIPGEDGQDGTDGVTPDFSIGTIETLAPGEQATATITGTDEDPVLNLGIPQGAKGDKGDTGEVSMDDFLKVAVTDTASGSGVVTIPDGANLPMRSLKVTLTPRQDGTPWIGTTHDTAPYLNRAMPTQSNDYNRESGVIVGGTVGWNQLVNNGDFAESSGWSMPAGGTISNGQLVTSKAGATNEYINANLTSAYWKTVTAGHKYLFMAYVKSNNKIGFYPTGTAAQGQVSYSDAGVYSSGKILSYIWNPSDEYRIQMQFRCYTGSGITTDLSLTLKNVVGFDLTAMFGSTIADYIYSLEQATAGAGVAWFRRYFPEDYYPYSANTLQSVQATAHKTYDGDGNVIGNYALDSSLTLRGIPKLDASNNLYYDGDTYESDGTVTRKYGVVDLGTLPWKKVNTSSGAIGYYFGLDWVDLTNPVKKTSSSTEVANIICAKYETKGSTYVYSRQDDKTIGVHNNGALVVADSAYSTAESFKTAMSGVMLVYELATPTTTETADPYQNPQIVDPYGTEEYVTANNVPVGHNSTYSLVCPISGYDEVSANVVGKNLLALPFVHQSTVAVSKDNCFFIKAGDYTFSFASIGSATTWRFCLYMFDESGNALLSSEYAPNASMQNTGTYWRWGSNASDKTISIHLATDCYIRLAFSLGDTTSTMQSVNAQLELGSTATDYEPYQGQTYTADLGQTVYGGTVDLVTGEVVIDRAITLVTGTSSLAKDSDQAGYHRFYMAKNDVEKRTDYRGHIIANACPTVNNYANFGTFDGEMAVTAYSITSNPSNYLYIISKSLSTVAEVQAQFADEPLQVVYPIATPQTIQLTPQEIRTLLGTNNVWGSGDVYVKYIADTRLYILKVLENA